MSTHTQTREQIPTPAFGDIRDRLLAGVPVTQRRLDLAGISTAVLEGGNGQPLLLLHGPGGNATHWMQVIPDLVTTYRVVVPDLPGQGSSTVAGGRLQRARVLAWLAELIERTCPAPPVLVGFALGGAIAACFACDHGKRLERLVLVDALGLDPFHPTVEFGSALHEFLSQPSEHTHDLLWQYCAFDFDSVRDRLGVRWQDFKAYNVDRAQTPSVQTALGTLMDQFGLPAIQSADLERITVSTTLIWGRHDLATPLSIAENASSRYGWPLHVIDHVGDDPPVEQPEALVRVLRTILDSDLERRS